MKETYYFSHDYHASKDPKCSSLINDFGMEGYGLYWCIVEMLHEQGGKLKKFPKLLDGMAFELRIETEKLRKQIEAMINDYNLLEEDDNFIWSNRVLKNIEERKLKYQIKAEAGRIGGIKSGISRSKTKQNEAVLEANEPKEKKRKENKVNKNKEELVTNVTKASYGNEDINWLLDEFSRIMNFKSSGSKDRMLAKHLLNNFSREQLTYMIQYCATDEYAPRIGSVEKLWYKRGDIIAGIKSLKKTNKIISV